MGNSLLSRLSYIGIAKEPTVLAVPVNGALTQTVAGALAATTYFVKTTWVNSAGETTGSTETSLAVLVNNVLNVAAPGSAPVGATGWNVYVSNTAGGGSGAETKQNATPIAIGTAWVEPTSGLIAGTAVPGSNTASGQGSYTAPTAILPVTNLAMEDTFGELRDESLRNNDSVLQGLYQGVGDSANAFDMSAYPDLIGILLRAIIGPDTTTPAAVGTTLNGATVAGATSITVTSATGVAANQVLQLDSGGNIEYCKVASTYVSGTTVALASALTLPHANSVAVVSQTTHKFAQTNTRMPSYSLADFDVVETRGFAGCILEELGIKIDPKAIVSLTTKWQGYPSSSVSNPTPSFTKAQPLLGWQWAMTNGGASSNRGISLDWSVKREVEGIHASTGLQAPEEVFPGALTLEGTYKARFDSNADLNLFLAYTQQPVSCVITQPVTPTQMGASLVFTTSQGGFYKGKKNVGGKYLDADFSIAGINNATDGGTLAATLLNFTTAAY